MRALLAGAAAVLTLSTLIGCAGTASDAPAADRAPAAAARPDTADAGRLQDPIGQPAESAPLTPVRVVIPSIDVNASLLDLERDDAGVLEAPPSDQLMKAGWYVDGTVPGQIGPAVIAGHVDWVDRVAVFHRLEELRPGDEIVVVMSDRSRVRFTVDRSRTVPKLRFPTKTVYGPTPDPQLRVITCGGPWDDARNIYSRNVVVSASKAA